MAPSNSPSTTQYPAPRIRLRQIALVAPSLPLAAAQLEALLGSKSVRSDPGVNKFGLDNILVPVGGNIVEVVAPQAGKKDNETAGGRFMLRLRAPKGAGYMVITQTPDPIAERARVTSLTVPTNMLASGTHKALVDKKAQKIRLVAQMDRPDWAYSQLHPLDTRGGNILEMEGTKPGSIGYLTDEMAPWFPVSLENPDTGKYEPTWWVPLASKMAQGKRFVGVTISVSPKDDPAGAQAVAEWWSTITDLPVEKRGNAWTIMLSSGVELRFVENSVLFKGAEDKIEHLKDNTAIAVIDIGCVAGTASASASHSSALHALETTDKSTWTSVPALEGVPAIQALGTWWRFVDLPQGSTRGLATSQSSKL
ncbi:hypothetical protein DFJ74DRAFT_768174 [Hyaloraphidium curvatum]|nr:hypothetical protein DFJ74DRAFT_768174 [Hyaloraphidium curvatum]